MLQLESIKRLEIQCSITNPTCKCPTELFANTNSTKPSRGQHATLCVKSLRLELENSQMESTLATKNSSMLLT